MEWLKQKYLKYYFDTSVVPAEVLSLGMGCDWKSPSWYHDWYYFRYSLYFSIWSSIFNINTIYLLCLCLLISISLCQNNIVFELIYYCNWIFQCLLFGATSEYSRYDDIYICLCLFYFICVVAMISYWTLFLIQISNVGY